MYPIEVVNRFVFIPEFLNSQLKCISLFNTECLPRTATMLLALASQLCPIIGDLSVETCLPLSKTCGSVFILDHLHNNLNSICPSLYAHWLKHYREFYSLSCYLDNVPILESIHSITSTIQTCLDLELLDDCNRSYKYPFSVKNKSLTTIVEE